MSQETDADQPKVPFRAAEVPQEVRKVSAEGLEKRAQKPKRVIVIGAGMAGLVAGYELKRQGHVPVILEAQDRVGGRVYTLRDFAPGLYAEAGAMRIPRVHSLTLDYCTKLGLRLEPFMMSNPKGLVYVNGKHMTQEQADHAPEELGYKLESSEQGRSANELWEAAIADLRQQVENEGDAAWEAIHAKYDEYSLYEFLKERGFSEGAIEYYAVMNFLESDLNNAVLEVLREDLGNAYVDMQTITGGMDLLPAAFYRELQDETRLGAAVHAIDQDDTSVTVHYRNRAGNFSERGDYAICTLPFSVLRTVEILKPFSPAKRKAIRQLNYHASTKVLFQVRNRRWETENGITGGASVTDLPIRRMNYPAPNPDTNRGILLASYTWGQDALQWGSLDDESRQEEALDDVAQIHPWIREEYEVGSSHAWYSDKWARGAFPLFAPEQQTQLHDAIVRPEGRIHFAGDHCSLFHAWIQGALESGIRAADQIHKEGTTM